MTSHEILRAMGRRWYVVVAVFALAAWAFYALAKSGGTYTTTTVVSFLLPSHSSLDRYNGASDKSVIAFASAIALELNNGRAPDGYGDSDAPLYGAGIRQGVLITLPNDGGQWVTSYSSAEIQLQIVGRSYAWTKATQDQLVADTLKTAKTQQLAFSSAPDQQISVSVVPVTETIDHIAVNRTSKLAAGAGLLIAAALGAGWSASVLELRGQKHSPALRPRIKTRHSAGLVLESPST